MGEKDIAEKTLEAYDDVFSDIINVLLFGGKEVVKENELTDATSLSHYKADDDKLHIQERDVAKFWKNGNIRICLYGLENQTDIDIDIPLRVISYDGASYRAQLLADKDGGKKKQRPRYPVVTLVLYFGEERWNRPKSLKECLDIPDELEPFVSDYKVNVFEIAWLDTDTVKKFKSDFRIVADYFVQVRQNKDYIPSSDTIHHVHEVLQLMSVLTKDRSFEEVQIPLQDEVGEITMYDVISNVRNEGIAAGRLEGLATGRLEGIAAGRLEGIAAGRLEGIAAGRTQGLLDGQMMIQSLMNKMFSEGRIDDLKRAASDTAYLKKLLSEQGLSPKS